MRLYHVPHFILGRGFPLLVAAMTLALGCTVSMAEEHSDDDVAHNEPSDVERELRSAHRLLGPGDLKAFRPGRSIWDILTDIQWRGNFEMGCKHEGQSLYAISFELFATAPTGDDGEVVWAIFVDDKFQKFVRWPEMEMETVDYEGTPWDRPKPIKIGDFSRLLRAANSKPINLAELEKEVKARPDAPSQIDPGLTIAFLLLRAAAPKGSFGPPQSTAMNWDIAKGQWKQFRGQVKEQWGKLTDDDLDQIEGKRDQLLGAVQKRYGIARDEAEEQLTKFESNCGCD